MRVWAQVGLQEGTSVIIELINYFHDYIIIFFLSIIVFVIYIFVVIVVINKADRFFLESHILETIWTILPILILLLIAFPSLYLLYLIEEIYSPSLRVKVVGHQWYWEYQVLSATNRIRFDSYIVYEPYKSISLFYNLDVDNRLVLPSISNILFLITSVDVLHSWTVPRLGIKIDACPGRLNYLTCRVPAAGVYYGQCSEICGSNHRFMPIVVEFVPLKRFLNQSA